MGHKRKFDPTPQQLGSPVVCPLLCLLRRDASPALALYHTLMYQCLCNVSYNLQYGMEICDKSGVNKFQALEFPENPIIRFEQQGGCKRF